MALIEVKNLCKDFRTYSRREGVWGSLHDLVSRRYQTLKAVDSISFNVEEGELVGYIGPNGAGKSTSIKMLTGILKPSSGEISVMGFQPFRDRKTYAAKIGVVFGQRTQLWWDIAVLESFKLLAAIYRVPADRFKERLDTLSGILDLPPLLHTPVRKLSLGQRVRCDLAASLIYDPKILFLDEPTIGLDAVAKDSVRSFLRQINREFRTTIIMTTHDLREIEELCKRIIIIDKGHIIYDGALEKIRRLSGLMRSVLIDFPGDAPTAALTAKFNGKIAFSQEGQRRLIGRYDPNLLPTSELIREVSAFNIADFTVTEPGIEEIVMKIYREGLSQS